MSLDLPSEHRDSVETLLLAVADDDFVVGQRLAEWVTIGPTLEEDNVLSSMAQDEMGHARLWYELLDDKGDVDDLGYNRPPDERLNSTLVEQPHDDFADTIVVNFLYDEAEKRILEALRDGSVEVVSDRAQQALEEEPFHREHADQWLERLVSTDEARSRLERAFTDSLPRARDLFAFEESLESSALDSGVLARPFHELEREWYNVVRNRLDDLPLELDDDVVTTVTEDPETNGRVTDHTEDLTELLDTIHADNLVEDHPAAQYQP